MAEKLVRDRVLDTFPADDYRIADRSEMLGLLLDKLDEEAAELRADPCVEELADVLEVVRALAPELEISPGQLDDTCRQKRARLGGFGSRAVWKHAEESPA
jgi:predicted house-cleaning noncanonical NTP pyrophosphatase (MazG superfamily)